MTSATAGETVAAKKKKATTARRSSSTRAKSAAAKASKTTQTKPKKKAATTKKSTAKKSPASQTKVTNKTQPPSKATATSTSTSAVGTVSATKATAGRKAPTAFAARAAATVKNRQRLIVVAVLMLLGFGSSAAVGYTDVGRIDINQKIVERNARIANNAPTADDLLGGSTVVPVQNTTAAPDGGLIGVKPKTGSVPSIVAPKAASTNASSTATSTADNTVVVESPATATTAQPNTPPVPQAEVAGASSSDGTTQIENGAEEAVATTTSG